MPCGAENPFYSSGPLQGSKKEFMLPPTVIEAAVILWDFHHMDQPLRPAACIMALGSHDTTVAERAADLYFQKLAPLLLFSGGLGRLTKDNWTLPEAGRFAAVAISMGVPAADIILESKSSNTGENIQFSRALLEEKGLAAGPIIVVQKPYMERRTYATFKKQWPGPEIMVTSPQISFNDYLARQVDPELFIQVMTGDLHRIMVYPEKGFQIFQEVPPFVLEAFHKLVSMGYDGQLVR
jgi:uncharacterized SAM-binding protein YcdF (DUF218 family)